MSCPQRFPVQGSPAAGISDKYFITAHRAGPRKVPAASDPAEHPFLPGQKDVAGWGVQAGSGAQKASSFPPWCHVRSAQLSRCPPEPHSHPAPHCAGLRPALESSEAPLHHPQNTSTLPLGLVRRPMLPAECHCHLIQEVFLALFFPQCGLGQGHRPL